MRNIQIEKISDKTYFVYTKLLSSNIKCISYDIQDKVLTIAFNSNDTYYYEYEKVECNVFLDMLVSDSLGKFFCANIKPVYKFRKWNTFTHKYEKVGE